MTKSRTHTARAAQSRQLKVAGRLERRLIRVSAEQRLGGLYNGTAICPGNRAGVVIVATRCGNIEITESGDMRRIA